MASNRVIFSASLIYSLSLVLNYYSEPTSIFDLIQNITHLIPTKDYSNFSVIYSNVMKWTFVYSIAIILLSTTMIFASYSSFRVLITAITRHWKPFLASIVAAVIFPAILRPPSVQDPLFGTHFSVTLLHALFVAYFSVKLVTMPMLQEKFGKDIEFPNNFSRLVIFWQISLSVMQIVPLYLSKEGYKMRLVFGIVCEVMRLIWLASFYELMLLAVFIYENMKKKKKLAGTSSIEKHGSPELLLDELNLKLIESDKICT